MSQHDDSRRPTEELLRRLRREAGLRPAARSRAVMPRSEASKGLVAAAEVPPDALERFHPHALQLQQVAVEASEEAPATLPDWQLFEHGHYAELLVARPPEGGAVELLWGEARPLGEEALWAIPVPPPGRPVALVWRGAGGERAVLLLDPDAGQIVTERGFAIEEADAASPAIELEVPMARWIEGLTLRPAFREGLAERARDEDPLRRFAAAGLLLRRLGSQLQGAADLGARLLRGEPLPSLQVERWARALPAETLEALEALAVERAGELASTATALGEALDEEAPEERLRALLETLLEGRDDLASVRRLLASSGRGEALRRALAKLDEAAFVHAGDLQEALDHCGYQPPSWMDRAPDERAWWVPLPEAS